MPLLSAPSNWRGTALKILLLLVLLVVLKSLIEEAGGFSFSPRDAQVATSSVEVAGQEKAARAAWPEFTLAPESLPGQTYSGLSEMLRKSGYPVRCYGNLKRNEKLYPSITQLCWTQAKAAWGIPLENISFHFAEEQLHFIRLEYPFAQLTQVKEWFSSLPGPDAGTFGTDDKGNMIVGKGMAGGLMLTAPPARGETVMVTWETKALFSLRCGEKNRSITETQKRILCGG